MQNDVYSSSVVGELYKTYFKYPKRNACCDDNEEITYEYLWNSSHIAAQNILSYFLPRTPVPVVMKKSCITLELIWGIIKSGGCYCIIDPALPQSRICKMLKELKSERVISDEKYSNLLPDNIELLKWQDILSGDYEKVSANVDKAINSIIDIDPLYVMFTSGSTGTPKGVVVSHSNVRDFIHYFIQTFDITEKDVIGNQAPWDFDVSVKDIFSAAWTGACIQIISKKYFSFPIELASLLDEKRVTVLIWAVSALCILSSQGLLSSNRPRAIRKVIFSGEAMPVKQYNIWRNAYHEAMIVNVYGPTEITCNCTFYFLEGLYNENESLPIGRAFPNERVFLLNDKKEIVKSSDVGVTGEICVSGSAVSLGYYNNWLSSDTCFIQNPLNQSYREIIYMTGDLGCYNSLGDLCYLGRKDFQIKYMGHRIELLEIEQTISSFDGVSVCCCIFTNDEITCFVSGNVTESDILLNLRRDFPIYMIPKKVIVLEEMPLNKNCKIDRQKLVRIADAYR